MQSSLLNPIILSSLFFITLLLGCGTENEPTFELTVSVTPAEGGSVSPYEGIFDKNEDVVVTANPSNGWKFVRWEGDWSGTTNPVTLQMSRNYTIIGVFEKRDYPLTITIEGEGTVTERVVTAKTTEYPFQTVVELTPTPSQGWRFAQWGGDLSGTEIPKRIIVDGNKTVIVKFQSPYSLHPNGITVLCPTSTVGEKVVLRGVVYETVDRELLIRRRDDGADLTNVCTSLVTRMDSLFAGAEFNEPIGNWDVSNVTDMRRMFYQSKFNQPIGNWDVSSVTNMSLMFRESQFNQPIGNWDVGSVTDLSNLFSFSPFNQSIENWDVSKVTDMSRLFQNSPFNQPVGSWNVSSVTNMRNLFYGSLFNQPIGNWDVGSVITMTEMFGLSPFNQPIGNWDVGSVTDMGSMFQSSQFNQPIENWNVSSVTNMVVMFADSPFNQPIGNWDVGSVTDMRGMFIRTPFNQPIGGWNVSSVTNMRSMFNGSEFNQPINKWCVLKIPSEPLYFATDSPLTPENKPIWGTCPTN